MAGYWSQNFFFIPCPYCSLEKKFKGGCAPITAGKDNGTKKYLQGLLRMNAQLIETNMASEILIEKSQIEKILTTHYVPGSVSENEVVWNMFSHRLDSITNSNSHCWLYHLCI